MKGLQKDPIWSFLLKVWRIFAPNHWGPQWLFYFCFWGPESKTISGPRTNQINQGYNSIAATKYIIAVGCCSTHIVFWFEAVDFTSNTADLFIKVSLKDFLFSKPEKRLFKINNARFIKEIFTFSRVPCWVPQTFLSTHQRSLKRRQPRCGHWPSLTPQQPASRGHWQPKTERAH